MKVVVRPDESLLDELRATGLRLLRDAAMVILAPTLIAIVITLGLTSWTTH